MTLLKLVVPEEDRPDTRYDEMERAFLKFHRRNPEVFELFKNFTFKARSAGYDHFGAQAVYERIRWETAIVRVYPKEFKLNNNHRRFYVLLLEKECPAWKNFFHKRKATSKDRPPVDMPELKPEDFPPSKD